MEQLERIRSILLTILPFYLTGCIIAWWFTFKLIRDYNRVYYFMVHQINHIIYYFCLLIAKHEDIIPKFDEFVPLVFAQKKKFFFHTKHTLKDYVDLYYGLKDDILYTEKYIDKHLHDRDQLIPVEEAIQLLNKIYATVHGIWWMFAFLTLGVWPAVIIRPVK